MEIGRLTYRFWCSVFCSFFAIAAFAQEVQFAQFYNDPFQLNPALAGASKYNRAGVHARDQWPGIKKNYKTYAGFIDHKLSKINSGIALYALQDVAGDGALTYTNIALSYGYGVRLNYRQMLRFGARTAFANRSIDFNKLVFADQLLRETTGASVEGFNNNSVSYLDFAFGIEWKHDKYNLRVGAAADHLNQANQSFTATQYNLPMRYSGYVLYDHMIKGDYRAKTPVYVSYTALYKAQLNWDQLDIGAIYHYGALELGLMYRGIPGLKAYQPGYANNEAIIIYAGFQWLNMHMGYNYDVSLSKLSQSQSHGAHEITLVFAYDSSSKKKKPRSIPCSDIVGTSMVKKIRF
ncbi:MAG: PorP/SprF family type IX secretion system membrane protein [Luteibaculum sp.]